jgi:hypothetical protein
MATEIITNINSILEQKGIRDNVNFIQSTFNPAFYQFSYSNPGNLNIGDKIILTYTPTTTLTGYIIDITGLNVTIDSIPFGIFLPSTFSSTIVLPPTADVINFDVNVVAAFNPVVIEMQRQDFKDNSFQSTWNGTYVAIDGGALIDEFIVGETIELSSEGGYIGTFTILNVSGTEVTINKTWSLFNPFFLAIINFPSRVNFYVTLRITNNALVPIYRDLRFTPNPEGIIRAEISGALRSLVNLNYTDNLIDPDAIRTEETNLYSPFYFATKDNWIGGGDSWIEYYAAEDVKFAIAGAFQIGDPNNGYYNKYFANPDGSFFYSDYMPQWITQFEKPVYFYGFPFTISFLGNININPGYEDYFVRYKITTADGDVHEDDSPNFIFSDFISLARLNVVEILDSSMVSGLSERAKKIEFRFGFLNSGIFNDVLAPITFNFKRVMEQSCNTFYVRWLNTLGGWDYWLFENKIYEALKVENGNNYESYFDNISGISDFENVTFKNVSPAVQVGSNTLTRNEAEGLKILATSPKVYWYNEDISKWIGVIVEPGTFNIRSTKEDYFNVELTFVKPKYFNQFA